MILIDGNSLGYAAASHSKLYDGVEIGAISHFINRIREIRVMFDGPILILWDGKSWRYDIYSNYKGKRNINPSQIALKKNWQEQKPHIQSALQLLGIDQLSAFNMEADDLAARVSMQKNKESHIFITSDQDWLQLLQSKNDVWFNPRTSTYIQLSNFKKFTSFETPIAFTQGKALMGDVSDNISGVGGIGPVNAIWLLNEVKNLDLFLERSLDPAGDMKALNANNVITSFVVNKIKLDAYRRNMNLINLKSPHLPKAEHFTVIKASFNQEAFTVLAENFNLISIIMNMNTWIKPFDMNLEE